MRWSGPILTDSGGFQVFSLPKKLISDRGVRFKNEVDGTEIDLTPERSVEIQAQLGADVIMAFDECTPYPADEALAAAGVRRTLAWLERCRTAHRRPEQQALFGIVQGGTYLRPAQRRAPRRWSRWICRATRSAACPSARATSCSAASPSTRRRSCPRRSPAT